MTPDLPPDPPTTGAAVRIEVCEKHGLRYNAATDEGCARCRTEAGGRTMDQRGFTPRPAVNVGRSLLVAAALVIAIGGSLFAAHTVAYRASQMLMEQALEEAIEDSDEDYEDAFEELFGD